MTTPPRRRAGAELSPEQIAAFRAAIESGEIDPLAPMVPEHLAGMLPGYEPAPKRKPAPRRKPVRRQRKGRTATRRIIAEGRAERERKTGAGHPRASDEATRAVLQALDTGENFKTAAEAGGVTPTTARHIWDRERGPKPPPGFRKGLGKGGGPAPTVTPQQAREAIRKRGKRKPGGNWEQSIQSVAEEMGVSFKGLRNAIERLEKAGSEESGR